MTTPPAVVGALVVALALAIAAGLLAGRVPARFVGALSLLAALASGFGLYVALVPSSNEWLGLVLFVAIFAFFRLLSQFESIGSGPPPAPPSTDHSSGG